MSKKELKNKSKATPDKQVQVVETPLGFTRKNYILFGAALALIVLGFLFLTSPVFGGGFPFVHPFKGGVDGWLTMNLAPIMLVLGYCVVIPAAIIVK
ncbi:DUF3098 domain-containing protein [candidate division TA06 bacterium]|uniref:DUF3098 domain-containing protein n=1 Tax=candidate division TA06 bacterium TaxID=2250710 RepID=A0A933IAD8_UNCT6|nr:DUF3098 domain-containing protein [candidate division TA06 bacterium]